MTGPADPAASPAAAATSPAAAATPPDAAALPDLKEVFNMGPPGRPGRAFADPGEAWSYSPNLWPDALPGLRPAWTAYYDTMRGLGNQLMSPVRLGARPVLAGPHLMSKFRRSVGA